MTNSKKCQKILQTDLFRQAHAHMLAIKKFKMIVIRFKQIVDTPKFKLCDFLIYHYYSYSNFGIPKQKCPLIKFHIFILLMLFSTVSDWYMVALWSNFSLSLYSIDMKMGKSKIGKLKCLYFCNSVVLCKRLNWWCRTDVNDFGWMKMYLVPEVGVISDRDIIFIYIYTILYKSLRVFPQLMNILITGDTVTGSLAGTLIKSP